MARTRTLQDLVADVRALADIAGATQRHTAKSIVRLLNQSAQAFRMMLSTAGHPYYLKIASGNFTSGNATLALPADFVSALGLDVSVSGELRELNEFQFSERNRYQATGAVANNSGVPQSFLMMDSDGGGGPQLRVIPTPDSAYAYQLWYLPAVADMTATYGADEEITASSATFNGIVGWEDWIVYDTCLRLATRDAGVNDNYEILATELARIEKRIVSDARRRSRVSAGHRVDTHGRRRLVESANRWNR